MSFVVKAVGILQQPATVALLWNNGTQARNMATLKDISRRLKSVKSIQKITKSMKMVSAAKFTKAEKELRAARSYGLSAKSFYDNLEVEKAEGPQKHLFIAATSDRGLCGAANSSIVKNIRTELQENKQSAEGTKIIAIGDKSRTGLARTHSTNLLLSVNEIGKRPIIFSDASAIAQQLMNSGFEFDSADIVYNKFKSAIAYTTSRQKVLSGDAIARSKSIQVYDSIDADVLRSFQEFNLVSVLYYTMKENATSEQSSRMTAMDNATKNAGELINKLTTYYNRTRQSVITTELIEIISGAAALEQKQ
jgi:F-type H+-transporting ATPase subunit gamma